MGHPNDATAAALDERFAAGDADLRSVYDAHGALIFGLCRRIVGDDDAGDVTQEVFVSAWRHRASFDPARGNLSQWLVGIAKRRIADHVRSEQRHDRRRQAAVASTPAPTPQPDEPAIDRVADRLLAARGLSLLDPRPRQAIELAYLHGLTHAEISERTGQPLGTVKSDIRRGLADLRRRMDGGHD